MDDYRIGREKAELHFAPIELVPREQVKEIHFPCADERIIINVIAINGSTMIQLVQYISILTVLWSKNDENNDHGQYHLDTPVFHIAFERDSHRIIYMLHVEEIRNNAFLRYLTHRVRRLFGFGHLDRLRQCRNFFQIQQPVKEGNYIEYPR